MNKLGPNLIIDIGRNEYLKEMTPAEKDSRLAEIAEAQEQIDKEEAERQKKAEALDRLKVSVGKDTADLLILLGK